MRSYRRKRPARLRLLGDGARLERDPDPGGGEGVVAVGVDLETVRERESVEPGYALTCSATGESGRR